MTEISGSQLQGALSDYFVLESHLASTRSADAYKAIDRSLNKGVCVWLLRHPLAAHSSAVNRFLSRMQAFQDLRLSNCPLLSYGVDNSGMAFSVLPVLDGHALTAGLRDVAEAERRFISCLRVVEKLHAAGIVCGDLCASSFWYDRSGEVWLIGVMGSFDSEAVSTAMLPPMETLQFVAPEQRAGGGIEPASDVYALGVLGYYLFTNHFPIADTQALLTGTIDVDQVPALASYQIQPPHWAEEVLFRCMQSAPEARFQSAGAVVQAIQGIRQKAYSDAELPVRTQRNDGTRASKVSSQNSLITMPKMQKPVLVTNEGKTGLPSLLGGSSVSRALRLRLLVTVVAVFVVSLVIGWRLMEKRSSQMTDTKSDLSLHRAAMDDNVPLRQAIDAIQEKQVSLVDKAKKLEELVNSDDPLAHDIIVRSALEASSAELRGVSEKAIVDRARRLGMIRSAEQVRQWLRTVPAGQPPPSYAPLLKSLNNSIPPEARDSELREAYATNPKVALRVAAALSLDSNKIEQYQSLMAQLVGDSLTLEDAKSHSALGLILGHPELALIFSDDVVQRRSELTDADIVWLLKLLADRNDFNVRAFASLAVERGILSPLRRYFLEAVRDREDLPADAVNSLVRAAAGALRVEDVGAFGRWVDTDSEGILLAICADVSDPAVLSEAFDILAGKSLTIQPSADLVEWVRKNHWDKRTQFATPVGVFAHLDKVPEQKVWEAFAVFDKYVKDSRLINILVDTKNPTITKLLIENHTADLSLGTKLNLLDHPDPATRILAIRALKDVSELGALQIVAQHYDREKNPQVRKVFEELWVVQNRMAK